MGRSGIREHCRSRGLGHPSAAGAGVCLHRIPRSLWQSPTEFVQEHVKGCSISVSSVLFWCAFLVGCVSVWTIPGRARSCFIPVSVPLPSPLCLSVDTSALLGFTWDPCFHSFCVLLFFFLSFFPLRFFCLCYQRMMLLLPNCPRLKGAVKRRQVLY